MVGTNVQPSPSFKEELLPSCGGYGQHAVPVQLSAPFELAQPSPLSCPFEEIPYLMTEQSRGQVILVPHGTTLLGFICSRALSTQLVKVLLDFLFNWNSPSVEVRSPPFLV